MTPGSRRSARGPGALCCGAAALLAGCYHLGHAPAEPLASVGAVAVPMFENRTLRRGLEHELTRRVRREILETTPLHLARVAPGVPELRGTVLSVREQPVLSDGRLVVHSGSVAVQVAVGVYRDGALTLGEDRDGDGAPDGPFLFEGLAEYAPAYAEDRWTAAREALGDVAQQVALALQDRHDDRFEPNDEREAAAGLEPHQRQRGLVQRDADWFRVALPAERALVVTLASADDDLALALTDAQGRRRADAVRAEGREVWALGGRAAGDLWLTVTGPGVGARYELLADLRGDDWREPDDDPEEATPLRPGESVRGVQRDGDWFRVAVPAGRGLRATVRPLEAPGPGSPPGTLELSAAEASGLPLRGARAERGGRLVRVRPADAARAVLLRVGGDGGAFAYALDVELE